MNKNISKSIKRINKSYRVIIRMDISKDENHSKKIKKIKEIKKKPNKI